MGMAEESHWFPNVGSSAQEQLVQLAIPPIPNALPSTRQTSRRHRQNGQDASGEECFGHVQLPSRSPSSPGLHFPTSETDGSLLDALATPLLNMLDTQATLLEKASVVITIGNSGTGKARKPRAVSPITSHPWVENTNLQSLGAAGSDLYDRILHQLVVALKVFMVRYKRGDDGSAIATTDTPLTVRLFTAARTGCTDGNTFTRTTRIM